MQVRTRSDHLEAFQFLPPINWEPDCPVEPSTTELLNRLLTIGHLFWLSKDISNPNLFIRVGNVHFVVKPDSWVIFIDSPSPSVRVLTDAQFKQAYEAGFE